MPTCWCGRYVQRPYKVWRYPGVPIPPRLRDVYSVNGRSPYKLR